MQKYSFREIKLYVTSSSITIEVRTTSERKLSVANFMVIIFVHMQKFGRPHRFPDIFKKANAFHVTRQQNKSLPSKATFSVTVRFTRVNNRNDFVAHFMVIISVCMQKFDTQHHFPNIFKKANACHDMGNQNTKSFSKAIFSVTVEFTSGNNRNNCVANFEDYFFSYAKISYNTSFTRNSTLRNNLPLDCLVNQFSQ